MKCDRCNKDTNTWTVSMFNEQTICMECKEKERHLPRYKEALEADRAAVKAGNWNFPGIGL